MSDEEVLKLTVPDQLCENLDMIIVSNNYLHCYIYLLTYIYCVFKNRDAVTFSSNSSKSGSVVIIFGTQDQHLIFTYYPENMLEQRTVQLVFFL